MDRVLDRKRRALSGFIVLLLLGLFPLFPPFNETVKPVEATPLTALGVWSADSNTRAVVDSSILADDLVTLKMNVSGASTLNAFSITVRWDSNVLNGVSATRTGGIFDLSDFVELVHTVSADLVTIEGSFFTGQTVQGSGTIFTFIVRVVRPGPGSTPITIDTTVTHLFLGGDVPYVSLNGFFSNVPATGDLVLASMIIDPQIVTLGDSVPITVGIRNIGSLSMDVVTVRLYVNLALVDLRNLGPMSPNTAQSTTFTWSTAGYVPGVYTISATVTTTSADSFLGDNSLALEQVTLVIHELEMLSVTADTSSVIRNTTVTITAIVKNHGTVQEQANVTIYANNTIIKAKCFFPCPPNSSQQLPVNPGVSGTFTFQWNTTGLSLGLYTLKAIVKVIPGEVNTDNNVLVQGTVVIKLLFEHDLEIKASDSFAGEAAKVGVNRTYTFTVKNKGAFNEIYTLRLFLRNQVLFEASGSLPISSNRNHTYVWRTLGLAVANYPLKANVTVDGDEDSLNNQVSAVVILLINQIPTVSFTYTPQEVLPGVAVSFEANATDLDGTISYYIWNFGDGTTPEVTKGNSTSHTYRSPGTYAVNLTIWDDLGGQRSSTQTITVKAPAARLPIELYAGAGIAVAAGAIGGWFVLSRRRKPSAASTGPVSMKPRASILRLFRNGERSVKPLPFIISSGTREIA